MVNYLTQEIGICELRKESSRGADPSACETNDAGFACGAVVCGEVKGFFCPLGFFAFVELAGIGKGGAKHGGEADSAGVVAAKDEGMTRGLSGRMRTDEGTSGRLDVRLEF